jgi:Holliday junction resolvase RusA-like endonuclease
MTGGVDTLVQSAAVEYTFSVGGRPKSKDRPRMTRRGRTYTPEATTNAEKAIAAAYDGPLFEGPVVVEIEYSLKGQTITIRDWPEDSPAPKWVADVDNLIKLTLDGLQREGGALTNDKQVLCVTGRKVP